jgi:hypothetical protein
MKNFIIYLNRKKKEPDITGKRPHNIEVSEKFT